MKRAQYIKSFVLLFIFSAAILLTAAVATAQLDPSFGSGGITITDVAGQDAAAAGFVLPDGKILVVVRSDDQFFHFVRYNSNGTLDTSYGNGGKAPVSVPLTNNGYIHKVVRQPDGKIIFAGRDNNNGIILRYNENGSLDTSFNGTGLHRPNINQNGADVITSVFIQPDGKILVGGDATYGLFLLRYLPSGALDETFGSEGYIVHQYATFQQTSVNLFLQPDGRIYNISLSSVKRFNADGSFDPGYGLTIPFDNDLLAKMLPDGKFLMTTFADTIDSLDRYGTDIAMRRYNADGSPDTSFASGGTLIFDITGRFNDFPLSVEFLPGGEMLLLARTDVQPNRSTWRGSSLSLAKVSAGGTVTGKFLLFNSIGNYSFTASQPDGKILIFSSYNYDLVVARAAGVPLRTYKFKAVPFDFKGLTPSGTSDPAVFRPSERKWYVNDVFPGYFFGLDNDVLVPSDYIGDFAMDLAVFRPSSGTWYIARNYQNPASNYFTIQWGQNGDIPAPADYDGDGKADLAVFRPSNGTWYIRNSGDNSSRTIQWGLNGDKPVAGDFDGDGFYDIAVFRPSDGNWYILKSSDGQATILHFGLNGDIPVQEDYDGDGKFDIAVWRPSDGVWYRLNSSDGSFFAFNWGLSTDRAVPADYDGDLKTDIAVWRPAQGRWYVFQSGTNSMNVFNWGIGTDVPLEAKF
jgi:uncharacterized delta-60 repeat protein